MTGAPAGRKTMLALQVVNGLVAKEQVPRAQSPHKTLLIDALGLLAMAGVWLFFYFVL